MHACMLDSSMVGLVFSRNAFVLTPQAGIPTVTNHGISQKVIDDTLQKAKEFFALPLETKMEVSFSSPFKKIMPTVISLDREQKAAELQGLFSPAQWK